MSLAQHWTLDPELAFLNHGSFGACPREVLEHQQALRDELERNPMDFMAATLERRLDAAREPLAAFVGARPADLAFVPNASMGVSTVLRSLPFGTGDELLTISHAYNAVLTALDHTATQRGAQVVVAPIPFPVLSADEVFDAVMAAVTPRTKLAVIDHVTSSTGLVLPIKRLVAALDARGVDTLVDGAHAPGMLDLNVDALGAAYYTGNCHKWICSPKGAAFLHVRADRHDRLRPLVVSHGATAPLRGRSRFHLEMDWTGTWDPTAYLSVPRALEFMGSLLPGGWTEVRQRNHALVLQARDLLCDALGVKPTAPEDMIGSLATLPLPRHALLPQTDQPMTPLQISLRGRYKIEPSVFAFPRQPDYVVRISAQVYNTLADYERLAAALKELLA